MTIAVIDPLLLPYLNTYFQVSDADMPPERLATAMVEMVMQGVGREAVDP